MLIIYLKSDNHWTKDRYKYVKSSEVQQVLLTYSQIDDFVLPEDITLKITTQQNAINERNQVESFVDNNLSFNFCDSNFFLKIFQYPPSKLCYAA